MGDTASDDMIDIQIEESLVRESLMTIDSANCREDFLTLGGFLAILVLTALTGIFGPPSVSLQRLDRELSNGTGSERLEYQSSWITPLNRFIAISLFVVRPDFLAGNRLPVSFSFHTHCRRSGVAVHSFSEVFNEVAVFSGSSPESGRIRVFSDRVLDYDSLDVLLRFESPRFSRVVIQSATGVPDHTLFQLYFRLIFAVFALAFLAFLSLRLGPMPIALCHLEQKITIPLLVLNVLFANPFYAIQAFRPSQFLIVVGTIAHALFSSYFRFFVLVLFDSLRYKNRKTNMCFFVPKIGFAVVQFVVAVTHGVSDDVVSFGDSPSERNHSKNFFEKVEGMLYVVYITWTIIAVIRASAQVDVTERYKFRMYLASAGFSLLSLGVVQIVFKRLDLFSQSSLHFAISFAVQNVFVLLMAYYHWPYEMLHDQTYVDTTGDGSVRAPAEFLANLESEG
jgi:hypothetical protein